ncbi:MAG: DUF4105 domain-containing protein [Fibromonadales bacterium]|nr:DUF4105 domain-containing protein [Fibromonadales bacterium]
MRLWKNPRAIRLCSEMHLWSDFAGDKYSVFLVLAGPYPKSATSAFGHLFLAIAPSDSISFLNWLAVNFGADTEGTSGFDYYIKGINGRFKAHYSLLPVHEKIREYAGTESRDIRIFPLKISDRERVKLMDTLSSWVAKPQPYKFFSYNCSHGIYALLASSLDSLPPLPQEIMSPQELVLLLQNENRLGYPYIFPSLKERVLNAEDEDVARLEFLEWKNTDRDSLREKELAKLRYSVSKSKKERRYLLKPENQRLKPHGYYRLDIGTLFIEKEANAYIRFRPLLHDITDNPSYYSAQNTLELLSFGLSANKYGVNLRELSLVHIRSASIHDSWFKAWSYDFFVGYKKDYAALNMGFGKSFYISEPRKIAIEFLPMNSLRCKSGFSCDDFVGIETQLNKRQAVNFRYGAGFEYLRSVMDFNREIIQFKTWLSYNANKNFNLYTENAFDIKKQGELGLYLRFYI